jgi:hypothetical protein
VTKESDEIKKVTSVGLLAHVQIAGSGSPREGE